MKKLLFALFVVALIFFVANSKQTAQKANVVKIEKPKAKTMMEIVHKGKTFAYDFIRVKDPRLVDFITNSEQDSSNDILVKNSCIYGVNGGFYDTDTKPLGLIIERGVKTSNLVVSALLNGFLHISKQGEVAITRVEEADSYLSIQSGPLLIENAAPLLLNIQNDEPERRTVAAITKSRALYLFILYESASVFLGPHLSELPYIIEKVGDAEKLQFQSALNLDGGTASFFKNQRIFLSEFKTVGSVICVH